MTKAVEPIRSVEWKNNHVKLLDQRLLPQQTVFLTLTTIQDIWDAIFELKVRGAPAIGISAAYGLCLWSQAFEGDDFQTYLTSLQEQATYLESARPTAVNLFWAIRRVVNVTKSVSSVTEAKQLILNEAKLIQEEDEAVCKAIGEYGLTLFNEGDTLLTHCNAGGIATARYGTALAPFYLAKEQGISLNAFACETRPVLQGARLTAWELQNLGVNVTLITDNMAAHTMKSKGINAVIVGADRIAANGDTANKIGTFGIALIAKALNIPFYVAAPLSTIDLDTTSGSEIEIEERHADEIRTINGQQISPKDIQVYNPAFDITPSEYITGIITEKGVIKGNYIEKLAKLF
ncbi:S-methyl-5-thioribose-1-phosphate isomerase [Halalkalibacter hemicellulosilyticus]|uniref:Methylthioribose-1-phosphate isomerase n=1 Tax=Halalkalibacter hemicellulosilyticusJCM 9152 TaxID=1236971 RepID=W4QH73_9BACI|nr:S-methyl-5-thioribose-1-phosphate isomerase [Halalkalibacter hemicellulosilyticus]GAE30993.1 methylthioribose-1-phosphate isomerase [Halalkalibacter hemicellulosilyticusJCM 9152]